jgi:hypothetical protein
MAALYGSERLAFGDTRNPMTQVHFGVLRFGRLARHPENLKFQKHAVSFYRHFFHDNPAFTYQIGF